MGQFFCCCCLGQKYLWVVVQRKHKYFCPKNRSKKHKQNKMNKLDYQSLYPSHVFTERGSVASQVNGLAPRTLYVPFEPLIRRVDGYPFDAEIKCDDDIRGDTDSIFIRNDSTIRVELFNRKNKGKENNAVMQRVIKKVREALKLPKTCSIVVTDQCTNTVLYMS
jgi:hypothetical protein